MRVTHNQPQLMNRPGYEYYSDLQEQIKREVDPVFYHLEVPFKSIVNESRFCALAWKGGANGANPSPQRASRNNRQADLLGFLVLVWNKTQGSVFVQNFAWKSVLSGSCRNEHFALLLGSAVGFCRRIQKSLQKQAILDALGSSSKQNLQDLEQIPTWMYTKSPPSIQYIETLLREKHDHELKLLKSIGFQPISISDEKDKVSFEASEFQEFLRFVYFL